MFDGSLCILPFLEPFQFSRSLLGFDHVDSKSITWEEERERAADFFLWHLLKLVQSPAHEEQLAKLVRRFPSAVSARENHPACPPVQPDLPMAHPEPLSLAEGVDKVIISTHSFFSLPLQHHQCPGTQTGDATHILVLLWGNKPCYFREIILFLIIIISTIIWAMEINVFS